MEKDLTDILSTVERKTQRPLSLDDAYQLGYRIEKFRVTHDLDTATLAEAIKTCVSSSNEGVGK